MKDLYEILGVHENASDTDIKSAFRQLAKQYHPDSQEVQENRAESEERFLQLTDAYKVLSDSVLRTQYDRDRRSGKHTSFDPKHPGNPRVLYREGRRAYKNERFKEASEHFRKAVELVPQNPLYCSWLGLSLSKQGGLLHEARKWCEKATLLAPSKPDYYVNLALVYRNAEIKGLTLKYLRKALEIDPSHKRAHVWLDRVSGREGQGILSRIKTFFRPEKD